MCLRMIHYFERVPYHRLDKSDCALQFASGSPCASLHSSLCLCVFVVASLILHTACVCSHLGDCVCVCVCVCAGPEPGVCVPER